MSLLDRFHITPPEHLDEAELKEWGAFSTFFPLAALVHLSFIPMFALLGSPEMAWFNVGSVAVWSLSSWLVLRGRIHISLFLSLIELNAHSLAAFYMFGNQISFHYWLLCVFPVTSLVVGKRSLKVLGPAASIITLLFIQLSGLEPITPLSQPLTLLMQTGNLLGVGAFISLGVFLFRSRVESLEAALHKEQAAQHELQRELERVLAERTAQVDELAILLSHKVADRSRALVKALDKTSSTTLVAGHIIDNRVSIIRLLGRGGMGAVYLGTDLASTRQVAVKLMITGLASPDAIRRFLTEAELVSRIRDPAIVQTLHIDVSEEGLLYQVMEYVPGTPLDTRLELGPRFEVPNALRIAASIARALAAAHDAGVIHRDIKPANIMLSPRAPGVRILDFGISRFTERDNDTKLTGTHQILGTPAYMAPEQIVDTRLVCTATDVYSFGVMLFELLTGELPFQASSHIKLFTLHTSTEPPDIRDHHDTIPEPVATLLTACLQKSPEDRPSAQHAFSVLEQAADALHAPSPERINQSDPALDTEEPLEAGPTRPGTLTSPYDAGLGFDVTRDST